eukprot:403362512
MQTFELENQVAMMISQKQSEQLILIGNSSLQNSEYIKTYLKVNLIKRQLQANITTSINDGTGEITAAYNTRVSTINITNLITSSNDNASSDNTSAMVTNSTSSYKKQSGLDAFFYYGIPSFVIFVVIALLVFVCKVLLKKDRRNKRYSCRSDPFKCLRFKKNQNSIKIQPPEADPALDVTRTSRELNKKIGRHNKSYSNTSQTAIYLNAQPVIQSTQIDCTFQGPQDFSVSMMTFSNNNFDGGVTHNSNNKDYSSLKHLHTGNSDNWENPTPKYQIE